MLRSDKLNSETRGSYGQENAGSQSRNALPELGSVSPLTFGPGHGDLPAMSTPVRNSRRWWRTS